jgi:hypothetical protein
MAVLTILFVSWLALRGIGALGVARLSTWQHSACYALAVMFVFTVFHPVEVRDSGGPKAEARFRSPFLSRFQGSLWGGVVPGLAP